jgi:hypothetical protein
MAKKNELAVVEAFSLPAPFDGMTQEDMAEFMDELGDLDEGTGINCLQVKIPSGGGIAFEIEDGDGEVDSVKAIDAVIVFTHRLNAWWMGEMGDDSNKAPTCSSMDGKVGVNSDTGETISCDTCMMNTYGSDAKGGRGKACKNMRRIYFMQQNDPNFYCLSVPPTSIKDVNKQLARIMGAKRIPYTGMIVTFKLEKAKNANGIAYSKVLLEKKGILPTATAKMAKLYREEIKAQYKAMEITMDDYVTAPSEQQVQSGNRPAETAQPVQQAELVEVQDGAADGEFPPLPFG